MNQSILSSIASRISVKQQSTATQGSSLHDDVNPSQICVNSSRENHPAVENYNRNEILVDFPSRRRIHAKGNRRRIFACFPARRRKARCTYDEDERTVDTVNTADHEEAGFDHHPRAEDERTVNVTGRGKKIGSDHERPQEDHPFARGFEFAQDPTDSTATPSALPPRRGLFPKISFKIQKSKKEDDGRQPICNSVGYLPKPLPIDTLIGRRISLPIIFQPTHNELGAHMECPRKIMNDLNNHVPRVKQDQVLSAIQKISRLMAEQSKY